MYECNRALLCFLAVMLPTQIAVEVTLITLDLAHWTCKVSFQAHRQCPHVSASKVLGLPPPFPACFGGTLHKRIWVCWLPMLAFDGILFALAVVKAIKVAREDSPSPILLTVLLRDSVVYFGGASAIAVTNLVVWVAARVRTTMLHAFYCAHSDTFVGHSLRWSW